MTEKKTISLPAEMNSLAVATEFAEEYFSALDVPMRTIMQLNIAMDEILSNIVYYSGAKHFQVICAAEENGYSVTFIDDGTPYDPTQQETPDVSKTLEGDKIGGLGIFLVKQSMDDVRYEYRDGKNCLFIKKQ